MERKIAFHRTQLIGVPLLLILPVLALLGLFGRTEAVATSESRTLQVRYPERIRYRMPEKLEVSFTNDGQAGKVLLAISTGYLKAFAETMPTSQPVSVSSKEHLYELGEVQAGETKTLSIDFRADSPGLHQGWVEIRPEGGASQDRVEFQTLTYP